MGLLSNLLNAVALIIFLFADIFSDAKHAVTGMDLLMNGSLDLSHPFLPWLVVFGTLGGLSLNMLFWKNHSLLKRVARICFVLVTCAFFGACLVKPELAADNFRLIAGGFWLSALIVALNLLLAGIMLTLPTDNYLKELDE